MRRGSGTDLLAVSLLNPLCKGKDHMRGKGVMFFAEGQEKPAVLEDIQDRAQIPERRDNEGDVFGDTLQFLKKCGRIFDMFDRMGTKRVFKLPGGKGEAVDVIDHDQVRHLGVLDDVHVDSAPVRLSAADIEIPGLPPVADDPAHDPVAEPVEGGQEDGEGGGDAKKGEEHGDRRLGSLNKIRRTCPSPCSATGEI